MESPRFARVTHLGKPGRVGPGGVTSQPEANPFEMHVPFTAAGRPSGRFACGVRRLPRAPAGEGTERRRLAWRERLDARFE